MASYVAAVAAGAVGATLWRRTAAAGNIVRRATARPAFRTAAITGPAANLANAGWAEVTDAEGLVLGRARVLLSAAGQAPAEGAPLEGELRSLRLTSGVLRLFPGRYWVRFETSENAHAIEVTAAAGDVGSEFAAIRWDDPDLPASLIERAAN